MAADRNSAIELLDRLHVAQGAFYAGDEGIAFEHLLRPDITWVVPGANRIAGTYRGLDDVTEYFRRRRDLAQRTFRMQRRDVLVGEGNRVAALTDGFATIDGVQRHWSTVGLYEILEGRVAACWLLPLDQPAFDAAWGG